MPDHREHEVRREELAEGVDQREEEDPEADHREPVRSRHDRQPRHAGVAEELAHQGAGASALVVAAVLGLSQPEGREEVVHRLGEEGDGDGGDAEADDDGDDLEGTHAGESTDGLTSAPGM
ncbi:hypothetical protein GCM10009740_01360 [Terrabacter terrae]|uniref:Uncharacterized protein n=1 Tax=Terrabacter terrae TaxID=318434 RepID=A0ABN2TRQ0_9MICO